MTRFTIACCTLLAVSTGCTSWLDTPSGFAELDDSAYDYRATNADGVVIAVRELDNDPEADLEFWAGAIDAKLRRQYTAESVEPVRTRAGMEGVQVRYVTSRNGRAHRYWTTLFVTEDDVYLIEAAGDAELFDAQVDEVEQAISSFEI
jgi:hypothetical protein